MASKTAKTITIRYFALLREESQKTEETFSTKSTTPLELFKELKAHYQFTLPMDSLRIAINDEFKPWNVKLKSGDDIVFIPPVSGG